MWGKRFASCCEELTMRGVRAQRGRMQLRSRGRCLPEAQALLGLLQMASCACLMLAALQPCPAVPAASKPILLRQRCGLQFANLASPVAPQQLLASRWDTVGLPDLQAAVRRRPAGPCRRKWQSWRAQGRNQACWSAPCRQETWCSVRQRSPWC